MSKKQIIGILIAACAGLLVSCMLSNHGSEIGNPLELTPEDTMEFHEKQQSINASCE